MQSLPKEDDVTRKGFFWKCLFKLSQFSFLWFDLEMNDLVDEMIAAVDDGDGEIDYDEFVNMIQKY